MKQRPKLLFFPKEGQRPNESRRGPEGRLTMGWRAPPSWQRPGVVRPPWWPSDATLPPIKSLPKENPKIVGDFPRTVLQRHRHRRPISGTEVSVSAPCRDGEVLPEPSPSVSIAVSVISIHLTTISIVVAASDDEEGVVFPRG
jgi:hypothetical protein